MKVGRRHNSGYVDLKSMRDMYVKKKVSNWFHTIDQLSIMATNHIPQAVFAAMITNRIISRIDELSHPLKSAIIANALVLAVFGKMVDDTICAIVSFSINSVA